MTRTAVGRASPTSTFATLAAIALLAGCAGDPEPVVTVTRARVPPSPPPAPPPTSPLPSAEAPADPWRAVVEARDVALDAAETARLWAGIRRLWPDAAARLLVDDEGVYAPSATSIRLAPDRDRPRLVISATMTSRLPAGIHEASPIAVIVADFAARVVALGVIDVGRGRRVYAVDPATAPWGELVIRVRCRGAVDLVEIQVWGAVDGRLALAWVEHPDGSLYDGKRARIGVIRPWPRPTEQQLLERLRSDDPMRILTALSELISTRPVQAIANSPELATIVTPLIHHDDPLVATLARQLLRAADDD